MVTAITYQLSIVFNTASTPTRHYMHFYPSKANGAMVGREWEGEIRALNYGQGWGNSKGYKLSVLSSGYLMYSTVISNNVRLKPAESRPCVLKKKLKVLGRGIY